MIYAVEVPENNPLHDILPVKAILFDAATEKEARSMTLKDPVTRGAGLRQPVPFDPKKHTSIMKTKWITREDFRECMELIRKHTEGK